MRSNKVGICIGELENSGGEHQSRTDMIKDKNGNLFGDTKSTLNRWKNYFSSVLNINDREEGGLNENTITPRSRS